MALQKSRANLFLYVQLNRTTTLYYLEPFNKRLPSFLFFLQFNLRSVSSNFNTPLIPNRFKNKQRRAYLFHKKKLILP
ncbi:hypothetical protein EL17_15430 [Anditalea andensis]|uniref:Uncharacterized protein n=1 Tax=Anditalea andensis TaxID=1048983 RepID=A0A074LGU0_9BACT|nr:hypothetical protein EL17_15430 [Anditalea andensis]